VMMVAIRSSEMSVLTLSTRRDIPEDGILQTYKYFERQPRRVTLYSLKRNLTKSAQ
jgi:hypothetical protein